MGDLAGGWSQWTDQPCKSGCLDQAKGVIASYRDCDSPAPFNVMKRCVGERSKQVLCDDDALCPQLRLTITPRTSAKSSVISLIPSILPALVFKPLIPPVGRGSRAPFSVNARTWKFSTHRVLTSTTFRI